MSSYNEIPAQRLRAAASDPGATGPAVVAALESHLIAQIVEYRESMSKALSEMTRCAGRADVEGVKRAVDEWEGAQHLVLELEDILDLLPARPSLS